MSGLPKRYAAMGFKRGWALYKKSRRTHKVVRTKNMARRRRTYPRTRYVRSRARSYSRGLLSGGSFNDVINGVLGGAVAGLITKFVGDKIPYGNAISYIGAGYLLKNKTLETIGGISLGQGLLGGFGLGGNGTSVSSLFEG